MNEKTIIESIKDAREVVKSWPKWKQDLSGIESDYSFADMRLDEEEELNESY